MDFKRYIADREQSGVPWNPGKNAKQILRAIAVDPYVTIQELSRKTRLSVSGVYRNLNLLKASNMIQRRGPDKGGLWELIRQ